MKVSVIITAYNLERFVGEAIESAIGQSHLPMEVIVVDDCSTDGTDQVIRRFGSRIRHISLSKNQGALRAALAGLREARGDVVANLDGDDVWMSNKLARCLSVYAANPSTILVSHQHSRMDANGNLLDIYDDTHANIDRIYRECRSADHLDAELKRSIIQKLGFWLGSAYTFRRAALNIDKFASWVDCLPNPQDVYLDLILAPYLLLTNPTSPVGFVNERLFRYRIHGNNSCNDYRDVERALRAVRRAKNTTFASNELNRIFSRLDMARAGLEAHERALEYYSFLEALYLGRRIDAARRFVRLVAGGYFSAAALAKEAVRLGTVLVGGPELFLRLKRST